MPTIRPVSNLHFTAKQANVSFKADPAKEKEFLQQGWDTDYSGKTKKINQSGGWLSTTLKIAVPVIAVLAAMMGISKLNPETVWQPLKSSVSWLQSWIHEVPGFTKTAGETLTKAAGETTAKAEGVAAGEAGGVVKAMQDGAEAALDKAKEVGQKVADAAVGIVTTAKEKLTGAVTEAGATVAEAGEKIAETAAKT